MQRVSHRTQSFDGFTLDLTRGCLLRGTQEIKLRPKPFDALKYLVENPGRLISKAELIKALWPDTAVTDDSLVQCMMEVRRALGDEAQQTIKTVPRRGYIFDAEVKDNGSAQVTTYTEETAGVQVIIEEETSHGNLEAGVAEQVVPASAHPVRSQPRSRLFVSLMAIGGLSIVAVGIFLIRMTKPRSQGASRQVTMISLTSTGDVYIPVISPDGRYLAYCSLESGLAGLRIRQVATGSVVKVVPAAAVQYWGISWSRDSEYIYYVLGSDGPGKLYRVPALGGHPEKLSEGGGALVSKDGQHLAFGRVTSTDRHEMVITDKDGKNEYVIPSIAARNLDFRGGDWSPDGKSFALVVRDRAAGGSSWRVSEFPIEGDGEKTILPPRKTQIIMLVWLADNSGFIMSAIDPETHVGQLSFISYPGAEEHRLTHDLTEYSIISATADGRTIVAQKRESISQLWIAPSDDFNQGRVLSTTTGLAYHYLSWTPDNHLVFDVQDGATIDIWKVLTDGNGRERLTYQQGQNREPAVTPDGRYVVFVSTRSGSSQVWRMDADGNNPKQLTSSSNSVVEPQGAPIGESVLYTSELQGRTRLLKTPIDGGQAREVIDNSVAFWAVSPDGNLLAYSYRDQEAKRTRVVVMALSGGPPLAHFDLDPSYLMRWTTDSSGLMYIAPDDSLWIQPITGGAPKQLTHFQQDLQLVSFASSPDGKQIAYARGRNNCDAVALTMK
jgi:Tol biopolymer transport system component/DNA-binding winged helix-turn-helix (wHTH) protein